MVLTSVFEVFHKAFCGLEFFHRGLVQRLILVRVAAVIQEMTECGGDTVLVCEKRVCDTILCK